MAKTTRKEVQAFVVAIVGVLAEYARSVDDAAAARHSIAAEVLALLLELRAQCTDVGAYLSALVVAFGARSKGGRGVKADTGLIGERLAEAHVNLKNGAMRTFLWRTRAVGEWLADSSNVAKVTFVAIDGDGHDDGEAGMSFGECFAASTQSKAPKEMAKAKAAAVRADPGSAANVVWGPDMAADTLQQYIAKAGLARVIRECAAILKSSRATALEAATLEALAAKFGSAGK